MLFYDVGLGAWVRNPGSSSPPPIVPCLTVGSVYDVPVQFCCGVEIKAMNASGFFCGIKPLDEPAGDYIASTSAATQTSTGLYVFSLDLTDPAASAYFTANPAELTQDAAIQIKYEDGAGAHRTSPMQVVIQNNYLQDQ